MAIALLSATVTLASCGNDTEGDAESTTATETTEQGGETTESDTVIPDTDAGTTDSESDSDTADTDTNTLGSDTDTPTTAIAL